MKKIVLAAIVALSLSTVAFAGHKHHYDNCNGCQSGYQNTYQGGFQGGFQSPQITVKQALSAKDNTMVTLVGTLTQQIGKDSYIFSDGTGEIKVEINKRLWNGLSITPKDKVRIYGKVDNETFDFDRIEIDVISIEKI